MSDRTIAIPDGVYDRVEKVANAEGATVEELVTKALERRLARRWLVQVEREGQAPRGDMTDDEVGSVIERSVQEFRGRSGKVVGAMKRRTWLNRRRMEHRASLSSAKRELERIGIRIKKCLNLLLDDEIAVDEGKAEIRTLDARRKELRTGFTQTRRRRWARARAKVEAREGRRLRRAAFYAAPGLRFCQRRYGTET
jgi:hypothetical protein